MAFDLSDILMMFVIFQLLFISIFLFSKDTGKRVSNMLLGLFFLSLCLSLTDSFLLKNGLYNSHPSLATWSSSFPLLYDPLLFLYTQSLLFKDFNFTTGKLKHLLPFILFLLFSFIGYSLQPAERKLQLLQQIRSRAMPSYFYLLAFLMVAHFCFYGYRSLRLISHYKKMAKDKFSDLQKINLSWLSSTIIFFVVLFIFSVINNMAELTHLVNYYYLSLTIIIAAIFIFINRVLFHALKRPEVFSWIEHDEMQQTFSVPAKDIKAEMKDSDKRNLELLLEHIKTKKPYLEPELSVESLAQQVSLKPKELSRLINENLDQNFFDFINRYRIDEAKRLLTNPADKKITVLEVLYEVGFNSKSSFNTLFKKYTGVTPSEFKKQNMN